MNENVYNMLEYFWEYKRDFERWIDWDKHKDDAELQTLKTLWEQYKLYEHLIDNELRYLRGRVIPEEHDGTSE